MCAGSSLGGISPSAAKQCVITALNAAKKHAAKFGVASKKQLKQYYESVKDLKEDVDAEEDDEIHEQAEMESTTNTMSVQGAQGSAAVEAGGANVRGDSPTDPHGDPMDQNS